MLLAALFTLVLCASVETIHRRNEEPAEGRRMQQWNSSFPDDWTPGEIFYDAPGDHSWGISRMIGILTMQGGFALLEAGSVRPANKANIMMKNVADMSVGLLTYAAFGYSLTFAPYSPFVGGPSRLLLIGAEREYTNVMHQFSFAATTGTIVSGALAERVHFTAYVVLSVWVINLLYCICAHWVWTEEGWLFAIDFIDFAGAGVVHLLGGSCALAATSIVGPRIGRYGARPAILLKWDRLKERARGRASTARGTTLDAIGKLPNRGSVALTLPSAAPPAAAEAETAAAKPTASTSATTTLRKQQIERAREAQQFKVSDPVNVIYGTFILFVGWIRCV